MDASKILHRDPEILDGTPVFRGTRIPVDVLWGYLRDGFPLSEFEEDFPQIPAEHLRCLILLAGEKVTAAA